MFKTLKRIGWALVAIFWLLLVGIWFAAALLFDKALGLNRERWFICK